MAEKNSEEETPSSRPWQTYHTVFTNAKAGNYLFIEFFSIIKLS